MKITLNKTIPAFALIGSSLLFSCNSSPNPGKSANDIDTSSQKNNPSAEAKAYKLEKDTGWGYKIFVNDKQFINQNQIPAISGIKTFASKEDAQKVGDWVAGQIKKGEPFGLSDSILNKLAIKY